MPLYSYKSKKQNGLLVTGRLHGVTADAIATQLMQQGLVPLAIRKVPDEIDFSSILRKLRITKDVSPAEMVIFSRQMYTLIKAGVPLNRSIRGLAETARSHMLVAGLTDIVSSLDSGRELSASMAVHPKLFSSIFISMVAVGENTGRLDQSFYSISKYLELEGNTKKQIKAATRYPLMVIIAIGAAIAIINLMVIPAFSKVFESLNADLPWATKILISTSNIMVNYWPLILAAIIGCISGFLYYIKTSSGRMLWDRYKIRFPLIGSILKRAALARFARSFAMASRSGVPILKSLEVVSTAVDNVFICEKIKNMRDGIERGETLTSTAIATNLFTPLVLQMIAVGEETGELEDLLDEVGGFYEEEVDYDIKRLGDAIEPILIAVMGVMVLILALGVFLPMWELGAAMRGG